MGLYHIYNIIRSITGKKRIRVCPDGVWYSSKASISSRCYDGEVVVTIKTRINGEQVVLRLVSADGRTYIRAEPRRLLDLALDYLDIADQVRGMIRI